MTPNTPVAVFLQFYAQVRASDFLTESEAAYLVKAAADETLGRAIGEVMRPIIERLATATPVLRPDSKPHAQEAREGSIRATPKVPLRGHGSKQKVDEAVSAKAVELGTRRAGSGVSCKP